MFYLDGVSLNIIKEELKINLINKKINRIFKNNEYSISLHFGKTELLFSCVPNLPICYINQNKEKPIIDISSSIISNLRKHLMNSMLVDIGQLGFDRILVFHFIKINELGEVKKYYIFFECLGKMSNIVFCDENYKVIDSLKKFSLAENVDRVLFNGEIYKRPKFSIEKISPLDLSREKFEFFKEKKYLLTNMIEGIGKLFEENSKTYEDYKNLLEKNTAKIFLKNKKIVLATVLDINILDYDEIKQFKNFNELINFYVAYEDISTNFSILKNRLFMTVDKRIRKLNKTLKLIEKDIINAGNMNSVKEQADILASIIYTLKKGINYIDTYDFYNNCDIRIELDPLSSPKENIDKMYKKYNKIKRSLENAKRRNMEVLEEIEYLESTLLFIKTSEDVVALRDIEEELIKLKYLKITHKTKKTKIKKDLKYGIYKEEDSLILYGRNNLENDNLTFKIANKNDYWFHAKGIPSSHIILKTNNLTEELIKKASEITAIFTKINIGEKIEIDYTQKKYVNKPTGAKPGFVTYTNQKSYLVQKAKIDLNKNK